MDASTQHGDAPGFRVRRHARSRTPWLVVAAAVVAVAAGVAWYRLRPVEVVVTPATTRDVARTLVLTGRVRPPSRPHVGSSLAGTVREVLVTEGGRVQRGQLLVRLDDAPQRAALAQAQAALATAEGSTRVNVEVAELAAQRARRDAERARALFEGGAISSSAREEAERQAAVAEAELQAARARTDGAPMGGASPAGSPPPPYAEVARARAAVTSAKAQLALTEVRAPADGIVLARQVEPGDNVLPGQSLLELSLDGVQEIVVFAREENLADLAIGARAEASADAFPDSAFTAKVAWLAPVVDPAQGTVEVRFAVPSPPSYLRPDMTISVNVDVDGRTDALVVPRELVGEIRSDTPWVVLLRSGRARRQPVSLGVRGDRFVEVLGGITVRDTVLPTDVAPGRRVRPAGR